ncbi:MAG: transposase [Pyrinomonadaceae bacterium]
MAKPDYIEFQERSVALAYFISFRTYGTWFHGDERGSVDRRYFNRYGGSKIDADPKKISAERKLMKSPPIKLNAKQRNVIISSIGEVCTIRRYPLYGLNVRTNHVHLVVGNCGQVERMMDTFKAYATRALRKAALIGDGKVWSRHGSTRYLWTDRHIEVAVDYVLNGQGADLPTFD